MKRPHISAADCASALQALLQHPRPTLLRQGRHRIRARIKFVLHAPPVRRSRQTPRHGLILQSTQSRFAKALLCRKRTATSSRKDRSRRPQSTEHQSRASQRMPRSSWGWIEKACAGRASRRFTLSSRSLGTPKGTPDHLGPTDGKWQGAHHRFGSNNQSRNSAARKPFQNEVSELFG